MDTPPHDVTFADQMPGRPPIGNRVRALLNHIPWYCIEGQRRLADDCGVSPSTISRLVRGETTPGYTLAAAVTDALSRRLGRPLDLREVFSTDGAYPTPRVCDLTSYCKGCFPCEAYSGDGVMLPEYRDQKPGDWCRYPPSAPHTKSVSTPSA